MSLTLGLDVGSTTAKAVLLDGDEILFKVYERHFSKVREKCAELASRVATLVGEREFKVSVAGSAGLGICKASGLDFIQEVFATAKAVEFLEPGTDAVIELGGEDAKILFLTGGSEERMNGSCAGGTGAFIDQMLALLNLTPTEFDELSLKHEKLYPVASRCGVFAKTDVQPLLNQGANKGDIAASIFQAVADQTIGGLAQGRKIKGRVMFLGGPLFYYKGLQARFKATLNLSDTDAIFPELAQFAVAIGAAISARANKQNYTANSLLAALETAKNAKSKNRYLAPLFKDEKELEEFRARHAKASVEVLDIDTLFDGTKIPVFIGVDCGSTTTKLVLIDAKKRILHQFYASNEGNPVDVVKRELDYIYKKWGEKIVVKGTASTGYGEELVKAGFKFDSGLVETLAHLKAAQHFKPEVESIIDIGGQDIKCFFIKNGIIGEIMLNEACSSGCGSFISSFANSMGHEVREFSKFGLTSKTPVELGSRCTVFMNSSVKEAQKEGASVEDISAGLSMSVVKNAIYKVIRAKDASALGKHVVVQGGTFLNEAVLRSFEMELGREVVRPTISGVMGAFGAALHALELGLEESATLKDLSTFSHDAKPGVCKICGNNCNLTINRFDGGVKFISGNRCDKPLGLKKSSGIPNLFEFKLQKLRDLLDYKGFDKSNLKLGKVGIPFGLNMYENLPFWHTLLSELGFEVVVSDVSSRKTFSCGQATIPSDTVCYPAKLMHGHIENLLSRGVERIFYPCMSYGFEDASDTSTNRYNCPVVAYYPELLKANVEDLRRVKFDLPYFGLHLKSEFEKKGAEYFVGELLKSAGVRWFASGKFKTALAKAYAAREAWTADVRRAGEEALEKVRSEGLRAIVLCGRPYHIDPEINHGIDKLITSLGCAVLSEDSVAHLARVENDKLGVLNQWSYHSRLYNAAAFVCGERRAELVQLVSFGCGIDSITTDEVREILERNGRFYTQLKIDEISNLGAAKIRLRSLLGAVESVERKVGFRG